MVPLTFYAYSKIVQKPNKLLPMHLNTLGDHIRRRRIEKGQLQKDVAQIIGVSKDAVTYWENNRSQPQIHYYPAIISYLGYYPFDHETEGFAGKIKKLRYSKGYSYKQMGIVFGINGSSVRAWERGLNVPVGNRINSILQITNQALST